MRSMVEGATPSRIGKSVCRVRLLATMRTHESAKPRDASMDTITMQDMLELFGVFWALAPFIAVTLAIVGFYTGWAWER